MSDVAVAVVGDGPAGSGVAGELHRRGVDVTLIGPGTAWPATYATWVDEVPEYLADSLAWVTPETAVAAERVRHLERSYGVFDNDRLARTVRGKVSRLGVEATSIGERGAVDGGAVVQLSSGDALTARLVVDATGSIVDEETNIAFVEVGRQ